MKEREASEQAKGRALKLLAELQHLKVPMLEVMAEELGLRDPYRRGKNFSLKGMAKKPCRNDLVNHIIHAKIPEANYPLDAEGGLPEGWTRTSKTCKGKGGKGDRIYFTYIGPNGTECRSIKSAMAIAAAAAAARVEKNGPMSPSRCTDKHQGFIDGSLVTNIITGVEGEVVGRSGPGWILVNIGEDQPKAMRKGELELRARHKRPHQEAASSSGAARKLPRQAVNFPRGMAVTIKDRKQGKVVGHNAAWIQVEMSDGERASFRGMDLAPRMEV